MTYNIAVSSESDTFHAASVAQRKLPVIRTQTLRGRTWSHSPVLLVKPASPKLGNPGRLMGAGVMTVGREGAAWTPKQTQTHNVMLSVTSKDMGIALDIENNDNANDPAGCLTRAQ